MAEQRAAEWDDQTACWRAASKELQQAAAKAGSSAAVLADETVSTQAEPRVACWADRLAVWKDALWAVTWDDATAGLWAVLRVFYLVGPWVVWMAASWVVP